MVGLTRGVFSGAEVTGFGDLITRQKDKGVRDVSQVFA